MSNEVFPSLPGVDIRVRRTVIPPPVTILTSPSDREFVGRSATLPRYEYELNFNVLRAGAEAELQQLVGFYNRHGGPFDSWLFKDPADNAVAGQVFGLGNGSATSFRLVRTWGAFAEPVDGVAGPASFAIDGVPVVNLLPDSNFELDSNADGVANGWTTYTVGTTGTRTYQVGVPFAWGNSQVVQAANLGTTDSDRVGVRLLDNNVAAYQGLTLTASVYTSRMFGNCKSRLAVIFFNASGAQLNGSLDTGPQFAVVYPASNRVSVSGPVPAAAVRADVFLWAQEGDGGQATLGFDGAQLELGSTATTYSDVQVPTVNSSAFATFPVPPAAGASLSWSGSYYRRCRFQGDRLDTTRFLKDLYDARQVRFISRKA